jgi:hypothetical protein
MTSLSTHCFPGFGSAGHEEDSESQVYQKSSGTNHRFYAARIVAPLTHTPNFYKIKEQPVWPISQRRGIHVLNFSAKSLQACREFQGLNITPAV